MRKTKVKKHRRKKSGGSTIVKSHLRILPKKKLKSLEKWLSPKRSQPAISKETQVSKEIPSPEKKLKEKIPKKTIMAIPTISVKSHKPWEKKKRLPKYQLVCPKCLKERIIRKKHLTKEDIYCKRCKVELVLKGTKLQEDIEEVY